LHKTIKRAKVEAKETRLVARIVEALGSPPNEAPSSETGRTSKGVFLSYSEVSEIRTLILSGMKSYELALRKLKKALPNNEKHYEATAETNHKS
jgi:hypothetical protein